MSTAQPLESQVAPAANRSPAQAKRNRRKYATDAEIDRFVKAAKRNGLTPASITVHPDGGVTIGASATATPATSNDAEKAFDDWQAWKATQNKKA